MTDAQHQSGSEHQGHCVLCTPAHHANCDEYAQVPMEMEIDGDVLGADVRVCKQHHRVIERVLRIENGCRKAAEADY